MRRVQAAWLVLAIALAAGAGRGAQPAAGGRVYALLIGINRYRTQNWPMLRYAVPDARSLAELWGDPQRGGVAPDHLVLLTDDQSDDRLPTRANVLAALDKLAGGLQPSDTFVFYFAGHGVNRQGEDYLLPLDVDGSSEEKLTETAIPVSQVSSTLQQVACRQVLLIVDACRDAPGPPTGVFGSALRIASRGGEGADQALTVRATLSAARPGQRAYEWPDQGHGVFTYYLLDALGGAAREDNGDVTVDSLARYVQRQVDDWVKQHLRGRDAQLPWLLKDGVAPLVLCHYAPRNLVTIQVQNQPLKAALQAMAKQVGYDLILAPGTPADEPVTLSLTAKPLAQALAILLDPLGLKHEERDGIIVVSQSAPAAAAAPVIAAAGTGPHGRDGMPLVLVPGGTYRRGSDWTRIRADLELPTDGPKHHEFEFFNELSNRDVSVDSYYLDATEVTAEQYQRFIDDGGYTKQDLWSSDGWAWKEANKVSEPATWGDPARRAPRLPVSGVSWFEADAYARWAGRRLPTEAEWEYAAQGGAGSRYDRGDDLDPFRTTVGTTRPSPARTHPPNPFGLYDLTGNVAEWCVDVFDPDFYQWGESHNPICTVTLRVDVTQPRRTVRGGGYEADAITARVRKRTPVAPAERRESIGFRCAADLRAVSLDPNRGRGGR